MPAPTFQIIFDCRQVAQRERASLEARLRSRLGLDGAALARLFGGRPVVVRRHLTADQAKRFARQFEALGAPCRIAAQSPKPAVKTPHLSDSLVVCPKCRHGQAPAEECHRCGLIFRKYKPGTPGESHPPPAPEPPPHRKKDASGAGEEASGTAANAATVPKAGMLLAALASVRSRLETSLRKSRAGKNRNDGTGAPSKSAPPYLKSVIGQGLRTLIYAVAALLLLVVGMWFARGLWMVYTATQVGERYRAAFPEKVQAIVSVLSQHALVLPVATVILALLICTAVATAAQFLHLGRYLYQNRPWWWRLLLWHLPLAAVGGVLLHHIGLAPGVTLGGALTLLPTLCLAPAAFDLGQALICEMGELPARLKALLHHPMLQLRNRIASHLQR